MKNVFCVGTRQRAQITLCKCQKSCYQAVSIYSYENKVRYPFSFPNQAGKNITPTFNTAESKSEAQNPEKKNFNTFYLN